MSYEHKVAEKRRSSIEMEDMEDDLSQDLTRSASPKGPVDQEKRIRREIANSNERRRMQSINAGFTSLKTRIPHQDGEKLSKAAILHQAADYINNLEQEKTQLLLQVAQLRKRLKELAPQEGDEISPPPKRKKRDTESSDEGISLNFDENSELIELRNVLQRERQLRMALEEKTRNLEAQLHPEMGYIRHVTTHMPSPPVCSKDEKMEIECNKVDPVLLPPQPVAVRPTILTPAPIPNTKILAPMAVSPPQDIPMKQEAPPTAAFTSPQSKRNLEIIAEAIRHLEGDNCCFDRKEPSHTDFRSHIGSEESQTESSTSDQEDSKSESSGRDSPVPLTVSSRDYVPAVGLERQTATLHVSAPTHVIGPMPVATVQMLHPPQIYSRPGFLINDL